MNTTRPGFLLLAVGLGLLTVALVVGFPIKLPEDAVYVVRGNGAAENQKALTGVSFSDGNLWLGAAVPTIIIGLGLTLAGRARRAARPDQVATEQSDR